MQAFFKTLYARWGDMDFNGHMKNTAYLDACGDVRMMFFAEHGFSATEFARRGFGPVVLRDEVDYYRELRLLEPVVVSLAVSAMSEDGARFRLVDEFHREDGERVAKVTSTGGWLDLRRRTLMLPPGDLRRAIDALPRLEPFEVLPDLQRD